MTSPAATRLLDALGEAIVEQGLANTTVADIARIAGTSKRTFYEHFATKDEAFLALYAARSSDLLAAISAVVTDPSAPIGDQIRAGVRAYLSHLAATPALARAHMLEAHSLGRLGLEARRELMDHHAAYLRSVVARARENTPHLRELSVADSVGVVAGLTELTLRAALDDDRLDAPKHVRAAVAFVTAFVAPRL
ncbi:possible transcriptional regulatory protein [Janibacter sp. HTCC2649]|uniref:TetR/AcrR family transcriptional regulator n=1 Tax=Janibacter sp. HTCC2649 TaxID=313589 RepID=UPI00006718B9|nr:TetR/AcrR family transcriptional regulator [Janibacter sp. HTCC2649]EAP98211.1 possible transcriptional regulatory protein [Janibacter sp. HTCC2649]